MMQRKQGCQIVCSSHAPAGAVVLHPVPNNGEDIALHTPAAGGLLAFVGSTVSGMTVVAEIRKQPPTVFVRLNL